MKVKPMIFNTEMVKALLDGRKTVTRRPVKFSRGENWHLSIVDGKLCESLRNFESMPTGIQFPCNIGDLIYVRETHGDAGVRLTYKADNDGAHCKVKRWIPSIHMPRHASRITLKVTDVRIEKLNDLRKSDEQVKKEGFENWPQFKHVWESIYGQSKPNDYVWVIEFEVIHQNVDKYLSSLPLQE